MKKSLIVFFLSVLTLFILGYAAGEMVKATDGAELKGKIVVHYMSWENEAKEVGIHVWGNGTGAQESAPYAARAEKDDFGYVMDVNVMSDADDKVGIIVIKDKVTTDPWNHKDSADMFVDVAKIKDGTVDQIDVYYFSGGTTKYFIADPDKANVFALYYDPAGSYEANLGVHAWGFDDLEATWGTPVKLFEDGFKSPGETVGKVAHLLYTPGENANPGLLIYAGGDDSKKHSTFGDIKEETIPGFSDLTAGQVKVVFVSGGNVYPDAEDKMEFVENSFNFSFQQFVPAGLSGTFAKNPTTIFARFTIKVKTQEVTGTKKVTIEEYVGDRPIVVPSEDGWKLPETLPNFTAYTPSELPTDCEGKVVFHYQRWDGDYTGTGLWVWDAGTAGSNNGVTMKGVDEFGAVMEIMIDKESANDTIGIIPIAHDIDEESRWDYRETPEDNPIMFDITKIKDGTATEIHVYYFQGGVSNVFVADPTKANVLFLYYDAAGEYEENLGFHTWGSQWTNIEADPEWGTPAQLFLDGFTHPEANIKGKVALLQTTPGTNAECLIYAGDADSKKTENNLSGFSEMAAGEVKLVYITLSQVYDERIDFAPIAFGGDITWEPIFEEREHDVDVLSPVDFSPMFVLKQGNTIIPIKAIYYNETAGEVSNFVLELAEKDKLDPTKTYTLYFDNGKTGDAKYEDEIELDLDNEAPVIYFLGVEEGDKKVVNLQIGDQWNNEYFPSYRVSDNRDSNLSSRVYVPVNKGFFSTKKAGTYEVTLEVVDEWGNVGQASFEIVVAAKKGCKSNNASIFVGLGVLGLVSFLIRRRRFV